MRRIELGKSGLSVPCIGIGCFHIIKLDPAQAQAHVEAALAGGANYFDVADSYHQGKSEEILGKALQDEHVKREEILLQSKCGIIQQPDYSIFGYDMSKKHIIECAEGSLRRLKTDYLDVLLLHRPDALMEPEEVAEAFETLHAAGKVRWFGVSNENPGQIRLLQKYVKRPLVANQLQLSIAHAGMISRGLNVNMENAASVDHDGGILDFCRLNDITIQPWSPFQYGFFEGIFIDSEKYPELNQELERVGEVYGASKTTIALAWLLRHPARMQPMIGTMNRTRLAQCLEAGDITITREEWYSIFRAAGNVLP